MTYRIDRGVGVPRDKLRLNPWNPNHMNPRQQEAVAESVRAYGQVLELLVRPHPEEPGHYQIIDGEHRYNALPDLVYCNVIHDLPDSEAKKLTVVLNETRGQADPDDLSALLSELSLDMGIDGLLESLPYTRGELLDLLVDHVDFADDDLPPAPPPAPRPQQDSGEGLPDWEPPVYAETLGLTEPDEVPEVVETRVKRGDIWLLGRHRLMCGDSTIAADVERLMDGARADMVFTDPPYGVDYDGGTKKREKLENDHIGTSIYEAIFPICFANTKPNAAFYFWYAEPISVPVLNTLASASLVIRSCLVWNKNIAQFGALSAQYKQKHEPFLYCYKKGQVPNWDGPTNEVTVWDQKRESANKLHPTQKPVELAERAIKNHSALSVLDLFLGSGSTLIACEKTGRTCYGMELSERYCDVILKRWEDFTGEAAVKS